MSTQCPVAQVNSESEQNEKVITFVYFSKFGQSYKYIITLKASLGKLDTLESLNKVQKLVPKILVLFEKAIKS